jgi:hypothetical protein
VIRDKRSTAASDDFKLISRLDAEYGFTATHTIDTLLLPFESVTFIKPNSSAVAE